MAGDADLAAVGALLSDRTRATILLTLLNGGMTSASALAGRADVSRPLASAHLRKLTEGGLITVEPHGRHRFYRLSSQRVADALESLILLSPASAVTSLRGSKESMGLQRGRLCYDHLAGRLGVALTQRMLEGGFLEKDGGDYDITAARRDRLRGARHRPRHPARPGAPAEPRLPRLEREGPPPRRQPRRRPHQRALPPRLARGPRSEPRRDGHRRRPRRPLERLRPRARARSN